MKKVLGLDLGTASIGWALVNEGEGKKQQSEIVKLGVRVIQYDTFSKVDKNGVISESRDAVEEFSMGRGLSPNAKRTAMRGARRRLDRYNQRRENLFEILREKKLISKDFILAEEGKNTTHSSLKLRSMAAKEKIDLLDFIKVLFQINKKRGYKSSRKVSAEDDGQSIDGMEVAKKMYEENLTPGEYVFNLLESSSKYTPDFYPSDLEMEWIKIWNVQKKFYPNILTDTLRESLIGKNKGQTWKICEKPFGIVGIKQQGNALEKKKERYFWRTKGVTEQLNLEELSIVLQDINGDLNKTSGYLGDISDRSKELYFKKITVGEYLYEQVRLNPNARLKGQVFYRQDYLDEFEQIWEVQRKYYPELTEELKVEIRDVIIFYQRRLKSQKGLISNCQFESHKRIINGPNGPKEKVVGLKVIPKSSLLFQEFKIWQSLNILEFYRKDDPTEKFPLSLEDKFKIWEELNIHGAMKKTALFNLMGINKKEWDANLEEIQGNNTISQWFNVFKKIVEEENYAINWNNLTGNEIRLELKNIFTDLNIEPSILDFDSTLEGKSFQNQSSYSLWHLLYSAEDDLRTYSKEDKELYGEQNIALKKQLQAKFGFKPKHCKMLANITYASEYGGLSTKAIKKILPYLKEGQKYSDACNSAGYDHSHSLTTEEKNSKVYKKAMELLPKNSLRNPVVEKILNQMVNVVNAVIEEYGELDEVRIELARDLKKSSKERQDITNYIRESTKKHEEYKKILKKAPYFLKNPTRNDIVRYKLYLELSTNGFKPLYPVGLNKIEEKNLFSKDYDIEHIIPKSKMFNDSFSNKTLTLSKYNKEKDKMTAFDYMEQKYGNNLDEYELLVKRLYSNGSISRSKFQNLLMREESIPMDFLERDLRNSQYIAKKAFSMIQDVVKEVNSTTGKVTDALRSDWGLINIMKSLNLPKYKSLGLTELEERKNGKTIEKIKDWTKRNDHRHHAMDALVVAFTTRSHVQYLSNKNTENSETKANDGLRDKLTDLYPTNNGDRTKRLFIPPMSNFRSEAKRHIENILVSFKANNKVTTTQVNKIKGHEENQITLTPRGRLHQETYYGLIKRSKVEEVKISSKMTEEMIESITKPDYKAAIKQRFLENDKDVKKAFSGKNSYSKNPVLLPNGSPVPEKVKVKYFVEQFTTRKIIDSDLKIDKVIDEGIKRLLIKRLGEFDGNAKLAFSNLEENPIWLDKNKSIPLKRVTITGVSNAIPLHDKQDHKGEYILNKDGGKIATNYVVSGNNHHIAIYTDENGDYQEETVSFFEAVSRLNNSLPTVNKQKNMDIGWKFLFTLKQNEMFLFPSEKFEPSELDLLNLEDYKLISKNLFRVQKISTKNYFFRHHLETTVSTVKELNGLAYKSQLGLNGIQGIVKVRINHLGKIVHVGEY